MIQIDWHDLALTGEERARAKQRVGRMAVEPGAVFTLRRVVGGYQAILAQPSGTELRFHGEDLMQVLDRAIELYSLVEAGRASRNSASSSSGSRA